MESGLIKDIGLMAGFTGTIFTPAGILYLVLIGLASGIKSVLILPASIAFLGIIFLAVSGLIGREEISRHGLFQYMKMIFGEA